MSLRQRLTPPLVIEPVSRHTHTVIFLHRFPEGTGDNELVRDAKVLSQKRTKNHMTLREQFPGVRWVFPHPKAHAGGEGRQHHWSGLSAEDESALGLPLPTAASAGGLPYVTQIVLREADRLGAADRVVLGGQGDGAEAAHDAMAVVPPSPSSQPTDDDEDGEPTPTRLPREWHATRLAGFVGMHGEDGVVTRDVRAYGIARKTGGGGVVPGTPHEFIKGGYRVQTATWDGRRIDEFAEFLEGTVRLRRAVGPNDGVGSAGGRGGEVLTPRERPEGNGARRDAAAAARDELDDKQRHALEITRQKAAAEAQRRLILHRIEADKVERKIKSARERQARALHRAAAQVPAQAHPGVRGGVFRLGGAPPASGSVAEDDTHSLEANLSLGSGG